MVLLLVVRVLIILLCGLACLKSVVICSRLETSKEHTGLLSTKSTNNHIVSNGFERAKRLAYCAIAGEIGHMNHSTDVVFSPKHRFVLINNVKAGSSSVRESLNKVLHHNWYKKVFLSRLLESNVNISLSSTCGTRTKTSCFYLKDIVGHSIFQFGVARDPITKFESGVRQVWARHRELQEMNADDLLDMQLRLYEEWKQVNDPLKHANFKFFDEHFEPSTWQLTGWYHDGEIPVLDFVGSLESIHRDWSIIVQNFVGLSESEDQSLRVVSKANDRRVESVKGASSLLTPSRIKKMCTSELYHSEWSCLGYALPRECLSE